ncbi:MAG TPA: hypothetical protein VE956_21900 [Nodularia sp. (in: cyanobacteria)]|nr:hypothetical protein [Nodularia sp. (in: cyanobacteria)]
MSLAFGVVLAFGIANCVQQRCWHCVRFWRLRNQTKPWSGIQPLENTFSINRFFLLVITTRCQLVDLMQCQKIL